MSKVIAKVEVPVSDEPWLADEIRAVIDGATCRVSREGLRWRYQVSFVAGKSLLLADGYEDSEEAAREAAEGVAAKFASGWGKRFDEVVSRR